MSESAEPRSGTWKVSQCPFVIEYDLDILEEITRDVQEGFQALPHGGLERGGLLLGHRERAGCTLAGHEPFPCEYASGPSFHLSERDRRGLSERIEHYDSLTEDDAPRVVGWYHSHTRSPLALSTEDLSVHYKLFTDHSLVALVCGPKQAAARARDSFSGSRAERRFARRAPTGNSRLNRRRLRHSHRRLAER